MHAELIAEWARENALEITPGQMDALAAFQERVLEANRRMNLTAITGPADFAVKHIIDSLTLLPFLPPDAQVIDIGTGAGFPGMVLRITRPSLRITLLDSTLKRVRFLREAANALNLPTECIHARAEDFSKKHPERYDICTARAVAALDKLAAYALPLIKKGGAFLAMKGPDITAELQKAQPAIHKHGGAVEKTEIVQIADGLNHSIVIIRKIKSKINHKTHKGEDSNV